MCSGVEWLLDQGLSVEPRMIRGRESLWGLGLRLSPELGTASGGNRLLNRSL